MRYLFLFAIGIALPVLLSSCTTPWQLPRMPSGPTGDGAPAPDNPRVAGDEGNVIFADSFDGGTPDGDWAPYPYFNLDNLAGARVPDSPRADEGVGVLNNDNVGGFAALSYAETPPLAEFRLETWLRTEVVAEDTGPLNGIVFGVDLVEESFYRVASSFSASPSLSLAYVGRDTNNFPVYLARWRQDEIPGGAPAQTSWHRLAVEVVDGYAEVYWNGQQLPGGPFQVDRVPAGRVGVYTNYVGGRGRAETMVTDFVVRRPAR